MTGAQLRKLIFERGKGSTWNLTTFAAYCGMSRQVMEKRFKAQNVNVETLKAYAQWKGIDEGEFVVFATGQEPVKEYAQNDAPPTMVNENVLPYGNAANDTGLLGVMMGILGVQKEQNIAILKLANAAEINAITIAKMNGVPHTDIDKVLNKKIL